MIPPLMSSTMNMQDLKGKVDETTTQKSQKSTGTKTPTSGKEAGRPEKPDE